jgi:malate/lactate dehydrogenase
LPHLVGGDGVLASFPLPLSQQEQTRLQASAQVVCDAIEALDSIAGHGANSVVVTPNGSGGRKNGQ